VSVTREQEIGKGRCRRLAHNPTHTTGFRFINCVETRKRELSSWGVRKPWNGGSAPASGDGRGKGEGIDADFEVETAGNK